jgi:hypothetical protein
VEERNQDVGDAEPELREKTAQHLASSTLHPRSRKHQRKPAHLAPTVQDQQPAHGRRQQGTAQL